MAKREAKIKKNKILEKEEEIMSNTLKPISNSSAALVSKDMFVPTNRLCLSPISMKLFLALVTNISREDSVFTFNKENINVFHKYLGRIDRSRKNEIIKTSFKELLSAKFEREKGNGGWSGINLMSIVDISTEGKSSFVTWKYNHDMAPYLLDLRDQFLKLELSYTNLLNNKNAIILYPYLRNVANKHDNSIYLSMSRIVDITGNQKIKSYVYTTDPQLTDAQKKSFNEKVKTNIIRHILGLATNKKGVYDVMNEKVGVGEINKQTDLQVDCIPNITFGKIIGFTFKVEFKKENKEWSRKKVRSLKKVDFKDKPFMQEMLIEEARRSSDVIQDDTIEKYAKKAGISAKLLAKQCDIPYGIKINIVLPHRETNISGASLEERSNDPKDLKVIRKSIFEEYYKLSKSPIPFNLFVENKGYKILEDEIYCIKSNEAEPDFDVQSLVERFKETMKNFKT